MAARDGSGIKVAMNPKSAAINRVMDAHQQQIEAREQTAMARGRVVLDENVSSLKSELEARNIRVIEPRKGLSDDDIKREILPGRIFITNNTKDFIDDASVYEYGIIALEGTSKADESSLAKDISDAIRKHSLWAKRTGFVLLMSSEGRHRYQTLTE